MTDQPDTDPPDALFAAMFERLRDLIETALCVHPQRRERVHALRDAGGQYRCRSLGEGVFEFRMCPPDGGLDGSIFVMRVPRSTVLAGLDGPGGRE